MARGEPTEALTGAGSAETLSDLAQLLRQLRRRQARDTEGPELTYREIAAKTGWSPAIIGGYLTGTAMPPTDRFDVLIRLLGATPKEQGALASARDRVADLRRRLAVGGPAGGAPEPPVPRQLPAPVSGFAGRADQLAQLDAFLADDGSPTVVISALLGTAGIGKTALAVHWAHRVAPRFPDGQLYVNLRGFDPAGTPMSPAEAVRGFLDALGVPPDRIPASLSAQLGLYRSLLADRRMLVVLDNARDADQAGPLLPGGAGCLVLITSRDQLTGLVAAHGAHPVNLDVLTAAEARALLVGRIGAGRVAAEPTAVGQIVTRCARLPLALSLVAARAAAHPGFPLEAFAAELQTDRGRLTTLATGDPTADIEAVFSWSYRLLGPAAARLFRLLGGHPGPDVTVPAAASLAGAPEAEVRPLFAELTRAHLVAEHVPGRYACHDLLRAYATTLAHDLDPEADRRAAQHRVLDHYLHTALSGALLLNPHRDPITPTPPIAGVTPRPHTDSDHALAWFKAEHATLLAAVEQAGATGFDLHAWQLAWTLTNYLLRFGHWDDQILTQTVALAAAQRLGDRTGQAQAHRHLGRAYTRLDRDSAQWTHLHAALDLFAELGDHTQQAHTHLDIGAVHDRQGRHAEALDHSERALALFRTVGHAAGQANSLNAIGWEYAQLGDHDQALAHCERALALHREIGDRHAQAGTWDSLAYTHLQLGHRDRAIACYHQALELYQETGDRYYQAQILGHLGDAHDSGGDPDAAREAWRQALAILDELGHPEADLLRVKVG